EAVRNREVKLRGEREEDGFICAHRIERAKLVKRSKGRMTDEEIEDAMLKGEPNLSPVTLVRLVQPTPDSPQTKYLRQHRAGLELCLDLRLQRHRHRG